MIRVTYLTCALFFGASIAQALPASEAAPNLPKGVIKAFHASTCPSNWTPYLPYPEQIAAQTLQTATPEQRMSLAKAQWHNRKANIYCEKIG